MRVAVRDPSHVEGPARSRRVRGMTLVEFFIALLILGVMLVLAVPAAERYRDRMRKNQAITDITVMSGAIDRYRQDARDYPANLAEAGLGAPLDPWGNPYRYLNLGARGARGHARKDHNLVPINTDYDLYSMGPDGRTAPPLTAQMSRDDIVRANDGKFVGTASDY